MVIAPLQVAHPAVLHAWYCGWATQTLPLGLLPRQTQV